MMDCSVVVGIDHTDHTEHTDHKYHLYEMCISKRDTAALENSDTIMVAATDAPKNASIHTFYPLVVLDE